MMLAAAKSRSASSRMMQASFPPSSICRGIIPAFFEMEMPVSPPVKLKGIKGGLKGGLGGDEGGIWGGLGGN